MMQKPTKILIIGNGFGGINTLKNLSKFFHNDKKIEISLIGEKNYFLFTPLLHEVATGGINPLNIIEPIRKILGKYLHNFYLGKAEFVNLKDRTVKIGNSLISYDYLVLAPGAETNFFNTPGAEQYSFSLKSIGDAIKIKNHCIKQVEKATQVKDKEERKKMLKFVVVGGGPTGVELVAELEELIKETFSHYFSKEIIKDISIVLVQRGSEVVPQLGIKARQKSLAALRKKGIEVMLNSTVKEIGASYVIINEGIKIQTETVIWVAGVKPVQLKFDQIVSQTPDFKLIINEFLQLKDHKEIFAIGDVSLNTITPLPALAQVAEKQSIIAAKNIYLLINKKELQKFTYHSSGNLLSLGQWMAIGEIYGLTFSGHIAWWVWRTIYLSKLISWRKKIRVAIDWTMNIFSPRDISQI